MESLPNIPKKELENQQKINRLVELARQLLANGLATNALIQWYENLEDTSVISVRAENPQQHEGCFFDIEIVREKPHRWLYSITSVYPENMSNGLKISFSENSYWALGSSVTNVDLKTYIVGSDLERVLAVTEKLKPVEPYQELDAANYQTPDPEEI